MSLVSAAPYQDYIVLAGAKSPGLAAVRGAGTPRKWDIQDGYGFTGATVIYNGEGLAEFEVDIQAWDDPTHFLEWKVFANLCLMPPSPGLSRAQLSLSIQHPQLNDPPLSITQVTVKNVTQWEQNEEGGLWMRTISFVQYRAPRPVLVKPLEGPPGSPIAVEPPTDPFLLQIQQNSATIAKLSAG